MKPNVWLPRISVGLSNLCRVSRPGKVFNALNRAPLVRCSHFSTSGVKAGHRDFGTRSCLVTGGASGIGYEVAKALILNNISNVTITSRDPDKAKRAIDKIKAETKLPEAPIHFAKCDLEEPISLNSLRQNDDKGSPVHFDTLINCAGITQSQSLITTNSTATSRILKTNLEAPIELSRQFLKEYFSLGKSFTKQSQSQNQSSQDTTTTTTTAPATSPPSFCIINISSLLAQRGGYGTSIYSTSKAGLIAFTRTLALEAAAVRAKYPALPPFRANVVVPGYIDTPMIEAFSSDYKKKLEGEIPLGRYGTAAEVADAVLFLLRNEYANNTVLNLDGGLSAV